MAATDERDDPAFPVGAACRIDARVAVAAGRGDSGRPRSRGNRSRRRAAARVRRVLAQRFVSVVDLETHEVIRRSPTATSRSTSGFDEQTGRVFTADAHSDQVTIIDSATLEVETDRAGRRLSVRTDPRPGDRRLYVGNSLGSTMSVIDLDTLETVATRRSRAGAGAIGVDPTARPRHLRQLRRRVGQLLRRRHVRGRSAGSSWASAPARSGSSPSAARRSSSTRSPARSRASTSTRSRSSRRSAPARRLSG